MTEKLKCPFCGSELENELNFWDKPTNNYFCPNEKCKIHDKGIPESVWALAMAGKEAHVKVTIKTPIGDTATTPVAPSDVCITPKPKEFSFIMELNNGAKISFEGIPNNAGLTNEQATTFLEDLFGIKETKK